MIKRSIHIRIQKRKSKDTGKLVETPVPIYLTIHYLGVPLSIFTGFTSSIQSFDSKRELLKGNQITCQGFDTNEVNNHLMQMVASVHEVFKHYEELNLIPLRSELKRDIKKMFITKHLGLMRNTNTLCLRKNNNEDIRGYIDDFLMYKKEISKVKETTMDNYMNITATTNILFPNYSIRDIKKGFLEEYVIKCRKKGTRDTTISFRLSFWKCFLKWLKTNKDIEIPPSAIALNISLKRIKKPIIYLTTEELKRLIELNDLSEQEELIRDLFLFCCSTGLRISDARNFKVTSIDKTINVRITKTSGYVQINPNELSLYIIEKYKRIKESGGDNDYQSQDYLFPVAQIPVISTHNGILSRLCRRAHIDSMISIPQNVNGETIYKDVPKWEKITTHVGRKTFVVQALSAGIPPEVVMKWTGHSNYNAMLPYIDITEESKSEGMKTFEENFIQKLSETKS